MTIPLPIFNFKKDIVYLHLLINEIYISYLINLIHKIFLQHYYHIHTRLLSNYSIPIAQYLGQDLTIPYLIKDPIYINKLNKILIIFNYKSTSCGIS